MQTKGRICNNMPERSCVKAEEDVVFLAVPVVSVDVKKKNNSNVRTSGAATKTCSHVDTVG